MARTVKEDEYANRRNEILDVTFHLIETKGYHQMTIQDILDELHISKGAFYHYFDSKPALLEALVERLKCQMEQVYTPILQDQSLPALEKLQRFFIVAGNIKTAQKAFVLDLMRVWYTDENAIVRQKMSATVIKQVTPEISAIIRQGIQEGVMAVTYPDYAAGAIMSLQQGLGDVFAEALLSAQPDPQSVQHLSDAVGAYTEAIERILGAPPGSLCLIDAQTLQDWVPPPVKTG